MKIIYQPLGVPYFLYKKNENYTLFVDLQLINEERISELKRVLEELHLEFN